MNTDKIDEMNKMDELLAQFNKYFKLKNKDEDKNIKQRRKINKELQNLSKKLRKDYNFDMDMKFKKNNKCVVCDKPGGNVFKLENNVLYGKCGAEKSCFQIEIDRGITRNISNILKEYLDKNERLKQEIIEIKLNILFNFINEEQGIKLFAEIQEKYNQNNEIIFNITEKIKDLKQISYDKIKEDLSMEQFKKEGQDDVEDDILVDAKLEKEGDDIKMTVSSIKYKKKMKEKIEYLKSYYKKLYTDSRNPELSDGERKELFKKSVKTYKSIMDYSQKIIDYTKDLYDYDIEIENKTDFPVHRIIQHKMAPTNALFFIETPIIQSEDGDGEGGEGGDEGEVLVDDEKILENLPEEGADEEDEEEEEDDEDRDE